MAQGPATPTYILRGHNVSVHTLHFLSANAFLASGDSEGWLVIWSPASKRPVGVWKAHDGSVTNTKPWGRDRLLTHGRDHKLRVWQIKFDTETSLSTKLPVDGATDDQPKPWLLHSMDMSALNFCAFSTCNDPSDQTGTDANGAGLLISSPNGIDSGGIDIFRLPTQRRVSQLHADSSANTGMVMAVVLYHPREAETLCLLSGYEDGQVMVHHHQGALDMPSSKWERLMAFKAHSEPVLALGLSPDKDYFITSSADAHIAKFALPETSRTPVTVAPQVKSINTKHAGQQGLTVRSDGKIFATAGWDSRVRVYSTKTLKELALLKWHQDGCYSTAFAEIGNDDEESNPQQLNSLSQEFAATSALDLIKYERRLKAQRVHWLAAGGKDGKISLWDIY